MKDEKAKFEAKIRNEIARLFIKGAKIEARAKERHDKLRSIISSRTDTPIIKVSPHNDSLEFNFEALKARQKLEEKIRIEKLRGRRILQAVKVTSVIVALALIALFIIPRKKSAVYYDLGAIKDSLQNSAFYYGQFNVEEVILWKEAPYATLELGFAPLSENDLKNFIEAVVKRYSLFRPDEKINLTLKAQKRIYAKASYIPHNNSVLIELMK